MKRIISLAIAFSVTGGFATGFAIDSIFINKTPVGDIDNGGNNNDDMRNPNAGKDSDVSGHLDYDQYPSFGEPTLNDGTGYNPNWGYDEPSQSESISPKANPLTSCHSGTWGAFMHISANEILALHPETGKLFKVNSEKNTCVQVGTSKADDIVDDVWNVFEFHSGNMAYTMAKSNGRIVKVDLTTGEFSSVGIPSACSNFEDKRLHIVSAAIAYTVCTTYLYKIDLINETITRLVTIPNVDECSIRLISGDIAYVIGKGQVFKVNLINGSYSKIGEEMIWDSWYKIKLFFKSNSLGLMAISHTDWWRLDETTGIWEKVERPTIDGYPTLQDTYFRYYSDNSIYILERGIGRFSKLDLEKNILTKLGPIHSQSDFAMKFSPNITKYISPTLINIASKSDVVQVNPQTGVMTQKCTFSDSTYDIKIHFISDNIVYYLDRYNGNIFKLEISTCTKTQISENVPSPSELSGGYNFHYVSPTTAYLLSHERGILYSFDSTTNKLNRVGNNSFYDYGDYIIDDNWSNFHYVSPTLAYTLGRSKGVLVQIDLSTGKYSRVGTSTSARDIENDYFTSFIGLKYISSTEAYTISSKEGTLIKINPSTGSFTKIGNSNVSSISKGENISSFDFISESEVYVVTTKGYIIKSDFVNNIHTYV